MNLNDNNNNHKNCGFGEDAAAYLYGEIGNREKVNFETHLANCDSCAEEFADFTLLRSGIADWKVKNFDVLAMPVIEIPYEKTVETRTEKDSWFDTLKDLLTLSPAFATIAAAIVLALFTGVGFLIFNSSSEEVASNKTIKTKIADEKPNLEVTENEKPNDLPAPEVAENEIDKNEKSAPEIIKTKVAEKPQIVTVAEETPKKVKTIEPQRRLNKPKTIEENSPIRAQKLPKLNTLPDEEEVNDLSLSDLLTDVEAK